MTTGRRLLRRVLGRGEKASGFDLDGPSPCRVLRRVAIAACVMLLAACGYCGPGPASSVEVADVVGRWVGAGCIEGDIERDIELVLKASGAYSFRWLDESVGEEPAVGTWALVGSSLVGSSLVGSSLVLSGRQWQGWASTYWVPGRSPTGFLLFGGVEDCRDPDSYMVLRWSPHSCEE